MIQCQIPSDCSLTTATVENDQTNRIEIRFRPRPKVAGTVTDPAGHPVADLPLTIFPNWLGPAGGGIKTDSHGHFEMPWEPQRIGGSGERICLIARDLAHNLAAAPDLDENSANLEIRLQRGLVIVGRVEDIQGQPLTNATISITMWSGNTGSQLGEPAAGASVSIQGDGQPYTNLTTDQSGRFTAKVCEGSVRIWANGQNAYASTMVESGDTNVVMQLHSYDTRDRALLKRMSLKGRPLPDLAPLSLATHVATATGRVLLCLFDSDQRPSRRLLKALADQFEVIEPWDMGVDVVGLQFGWQVLVVGGG